MDVMYILAVLVALLAAQAWFLHRFAFKGLRYARAFSQKAAFAGEQVEMTEVLRNAKALPLPWLRVESRMSPNLRFGAGDLQEGTHEMDENSMYHRSVFSLRPYSQVTRRHKVRLLHRGYYQVGSVALTAGDMFGIATRSEQWDTGAAICVYPRLLDDREADIPSSRWQGDLVVKRWIAPDPFLVAGIREWQVGDTRRDVHWQATGRTGRLQVKTHDFTAMPKLLVILNVQMQELQWGDLMDYEQAAIETGISLMATLCVKALAAGLEAGFATNAPCTPDGTEPTVMLPARYAGRDSEILEGLARLRIVRAQSFPTFLEGLTGLTGYDMLILSSYDSERIQERIAMLRLRGNSVALRMLEKGVRA